MITAQFLLAALIVILVPGTGGYQYASGGAGPGTPRSSHRKGWPRVWDYSGHGRGNRGIDGGDVQFVPVVADREIRRGGLFAVAGTGTRMSQDHETIQVYDERAQEYASVTADHIDTPLLQAFISALPTGARVLDLGCGPGLFAQAMQKAGLNVDATDASAEMVTLANQLTGVSARQESFSDLIARNAYDGVWANFSLLHAPRADMPGHLARIHAALKPGGQFHMTVKTGTGDSRDRLGRYYTYYQPAEMRALLEAAGFTVTKITPGRDKGLDGSLSNWISVATYA